MHRGNYTIVYIKGASGDACAKISKSPSKTMSRINGSSQNFLRMRMKFQSSEKMESLVTGKV